MKTWPSLRLVFSMLLLGACSSESLFGFIIVDSPVDDINLAAQQNRGRVSRPLHRFLPLETRSKHISVKIKDQIATTTVDQVFYNGSSRRLEGTFYFPLPEGANIQKFTMDVNGKMTRAELLEANKARGIYEDIVRRCKDPALMEYAGQALLKVRVFPIEPHQEKRVRLKYTQLLEREGTMVEYRFPLSADKVCPKPIGTLSFSSQIAVSGSLRSVYSPSHEVEIKRKGDRKAVVGFEQEEVLPDSDLSLYYSEESTEGNPITMNLLTHGTVRGADKDDYFMLLLSPGEWSGDQEIVEKDVVFALDTSGSMQRQKLQQAKAALEFCLNSLNEGDRFEVIRYATEAEGLFDELAESTDSNRTRALEFVSSLKALGGTAIDAALEKAVSFAAKRENVGRPYQVIFLTDGLPTIGATDTEVILGNLRKGLRKTDATVRVFCFGIGTQINTKLLDRVAEETKAVTEYVLPQEDIEVKVSNFYSKIAEPVLANLDLKFGGARATKTYPPNLPDLFKGDQLTVLGRLEPKAGRKSGTVTLRGVVNGLEKKFRYEVSFVSKRKGNAFIPKLWASRRVGYLLDEIRLHGEQEELKEEIVALAREHGIVTPYTSYLIIEDEQVRRVPIANRSLGRRLSGSRNVPAIEGSGRVDFLAVDGGASLQRGATPRSLGLSTGERGRVAVEQKQLEESLVRQADSYRRLKSDVSGLGAVAGARSNALLKNASKLSASYFAGKEAERGFETLEGLMEARSRTAGGKTFYYSGNQWIDGAAQGLKEANITQIKFGSTDYFDLFEKRGEVGKWLSIGTSMIVEIDGALFEIVE